MTDRFDAVILSHWEMHGVELLSRGHACSNCHAVFDPVKHRWRCPHCGWRNYCCD